VRRLPSKVGDEVRDELGALMATEALSARRAGALHILVELWDGPARTAVTDLLLAAMAFTGAPYVTDALSRIFLQNAFFADRETDRILDAISTVGGDLLAAQDADYLPEQLQKLLPHNPSAVYELMRQYVTTRKLGSFYYGDKALVGVSLFLQRLGGVHRTRGLDLLDLLFEQGSREAEKFLQEKAS